MDNSKHRILVVDDEADIREILQYNLQAAGYEVDTASSAEEALHEIKPYHSLILLDVMLGGMSGFRMAEKLRKEVQNNTPIIFLTAKDTENDLLKGFSSGGDDYVTKPFSLCELLARIKAILQRTEQKVQKKLITVSGITINYSKKVVCYDEREVRLSPKEFGILAMLIEQPGRVFTRTEILNTVWHGEACVLDRTVDVHIARVRRKLEDKAYHIENRQGYGYCFEP